MEIEEINKKRMAKEVRHERYRDRVKQYKQNRTLNISKENSTNIKERNA